MYVPDDRRRSVLNQQGSHLVSSVFYICQEVVYRSQCHKSEVVKERAIENLRAMSRGNHASGTVVTLRKKTRINKDLKVIFEIRRDI
jgi:hypothetical protein